ncbi:MAG: hypothetical protein LBQ52_04220 [Helicobacteraceae bacterium]|jgi:hypothetical protein|nr:hypothetical protein [Helicobacteraceae bacterium]
MRIALAIFGIFLPLGAYAEVLSALELKTLSPTEGLYKVSAYAIAAFVCPPDIYCILGDHIIADKNRKIDNIACPIEADCLQIAIRKTNIDALELNKKYVFTVKAKNYGFVLKKIELAD